MIRPPRRSTLFPYTPLSRSVDETGLVAVQAHLPGEVVGVNGDAMTADPRTGIEGEEAERLGGGGVDHLAGDRKSTRLNSSHDQISYAVFCLKKKKKHKKALA